MFALIWKCGYIQCRTASCMMQILFWCELRLDLAQERQRNPWPGAEVYPYISYAALEYNNLTSKIEVLRHGSCDFKYLHRHAYSKSFYWYLIQSSSFIFFSSWISFCAIAYAVFGERNSNTHLLLKFCSDNNDLRRLLQHLFDRGDNRMVWW